MQLAWLDYSNRLVLQLLSVTLIQYLWHVQIKVGIYFHFDFVFALANSTLGPILNADKLYSRIVMNDSATAPEDGNYALRIPYLTRF